MLHIFRKIIFDGSAKGQQFISCSTSNLEEYFPIRSRRIGVGGSVAFPHNFFVTCFLIGNLFYKTIFYVPVPVSSFFVAFMGTYRNTET